MKVSELLDMARLVSPTSEFFIHTRETKDYLAAEALVVEQEYDRKSKDLVIEVGPTHDD